MAKDDELYALKKAFVNEFAPLTMRRVFIIIKLIQHCRTYCRSNTALKNFLNWFLAPHVRITTEKLHYLNDNGDRKSMEEIKVTMLDEHGRPLTMPTANLDELSRTAFSSPPPETIGDDDDEND